jgi:imidazole glycerol phosphate synthase glutamine amidotransferase subunit
VTTRDADLVRRADRVVLPGVGTFGAAMAALAGGLDAAIKERIQADRPTLAVCVGHQVLFAASEESPGIPGLGLFPQMVTRFPASVRVPQIGWNRVALETEDGALGPGHACFSNSFGVSQSPAGAGAAFSHHGGETVAAVERGAILGLQFHPELSGPFGHAILARWLEAGRLGLRPSPRRSWGEGLTAMTRRVIPCLDCRDGRVVKGVRFQSLRDSGDPVDLSVAYQDQGADEIVLLDISATPEGRSHHLDTVRAVRERLSIPLTCGGGVRAAADAQALLEAGADMVAVNTAAVARPTLISEIAGRFGSQCTVLAIDAARKGEGWEVVVRSGAERTARDAIDWAREGTRLGAGEILLTNWDRDGTRAGYDVALVKAVANAVGVPVVASGGADSTAHMAEALAHGADAVLAASIFHEGDMTVEAVKRELARDGIEVRR